MCRSLNFYTLSKNSNNYYIFLNDGRYLRYDIGKNKVDIEGKTAEAWPGTAPYSKHIRGVSEDGYFFIKMPNDLYNYNK